MRALKVPSFLHPRRVERSNNGSLQHVRARIVNQLFPDFPKKRGVFIGIEDTRSRLVYPKDLTTPVALPRFADPQDVALHLHRQLARGVLLNEDDFLNHCHFNVFRFVRGQLTDLLASPEHQFEIWRRLVNQIQFLILSYNPADIDPRPQVITEDLRIANGVKGYRFHYSMMFGGQIYDHDEPRMGLVPVEFLPDASASTYVYEAPFERLYKSRNYHQFQRGTQSPVAIDTWKSRQSQPTVRQDQLYPYTRNDFHSRGLYHLQAMASQMGLDNTVRVICNLLMGPQTIWGGQHSLNLVFYTVPEMNADRSFMTQMEDVLAQVVHEKGIRKLQAQFIELD